MPQTSLTVEADTTAPTVTAATAAVEATDQASYQIQGPGGSSGRILIEADEGGDADGIVGNEWVVRSTDNDGALTVSVNTNLKQIRIASDLDNPDTQAAAFDVVNALNNDATFAALFDATLTRVGPLRRDLADVPLTGGESTANVVVQWSEGVQGLPVLDPAKHGIDADGDGFTDYTVADALGLPGTVADVSEVESAGTIKVAVLVSQLPPPPFGDGAALRLEAGAATDLSGNASGTQVVPFTAG